MFAARKTVYTHRFWWTHLDELLAGFLCEKFIFSENNFTMEDDMIEIDDDKVKPWHFAIGVGRGELDDKDQYGNRRDTCVARLIAEKYNLFTEHPEIEQLVKDVEWVDIHGPNGKLCMSKIIKNIAYQYGKLEAIKMARIMFETRIYSNYKMFHDPDTISKYDNAKKVYHQKGQIIIFAQFEEDVPCEYAFNNGASVVIIYNPLSGNVQILGNKKKAINLRKIFEELKEYENDNTGEMWYFHPPTMLFNGSKTHNAKATSLALKEIINIVENNI